MRIGLMPRRVLRHPSSNEVWIYIDRLNKKNRRVWEVQYRNYNGRPVTRVARYISINVPSHTRYHGFDSGEPRAYLVVNRPCLVRWEKSRVFIERMSA